MKSEKSLWTSDFWMSKLFLAEREVMDWLYNQTLFYVNNMKLSDLKISTKSSEDDWFFVKNNKVYWNFQKPDDYFPLALISYKHDRYKQYCTLPYYAREQVLNAIKRSKYPNELRNNVKVKKLLENI